MSNKDSVLVCVCVCAAGAVYYCPNPTADCSEAFYHMNPAVTKPDCIYILYVHCMCGAVRVACCLL